MPAPMIAAAAAKSTSARITSSSTAPRAERCFNGSTGKTAIRRGCLISFPLTPALSPSAGEREKRLTLLDQSTRSELAFERRTDLPLPLGGGEGRGEGDATNTNPGRNEYRQRLSGIVVFIGNTPAREPG